MLNLLDRINVGYAPLEPVLLGLMAAQKSFMLIGRHGAGKTRLAEALSRGYGRDGFVFYDATKDDLISIAGIPDAAGMQTGSLRFIPHQRTIWNKSTIVVDEITRASRENQNLWLEIIENRTCFGLPLPYRSLIATANPESYAAAFQLDEALLDRFHAVLPVPDLQAGVRDSDVARIVALAAHKPESGIEAEELARVFASIQAAAQSLIKGGGAGRIQNYVAALVPALLVRMQETGGPYVSPRTYGRNLPETILAAGAYFEMCGRPDALMHGALDALRYAISTKLQVHFHLLSQLHESTREILRGSAPDQGQSLRLEMQGLISFEDRLQFLKKRWSGIQQRLKQDELEKLMGELLAGASKQGEKEKLVQLREALAELGYQGDALRQVDGHLLILINQGISRIMPLIGKILASAAVSAPAAEAMRSFSSMVKQGTLCTARSPDALRLVSWLIDVVEGDVVLSEETAASFFAQLKLALDGESYGSGSPSD